MSIFNEIKVNKPTSNTFNLSHDRKMSLNMGNLTPTLVMDVLPGDKIKLSSTQMLRFAPMLAPVMHRIDVFQHFFFVPNRLTWSNWEDFITGGEDGYADPVFPTIKYNETNGTIGSLPDYLGLPQIQAGGISTGTVKVSALPFAAYQIIYNEFFRDQNLIAKTDTSLVDGNQSNTTELLTLQKRAWGHDYFTSALPWTQKGPEATIPLGTTANINFQPNEDAEVTMRLYDGTIAPSGSLSVDTNFAQNKSAMESGSTEVVHDNSTFLQADLSTATSSSINDLRQAFRLQEWLEKNARGGSRYIEVIKSHFGVSSSDSRLQRPEYLGGGKSPVSISEVLQTSETGVASQSPTPQGNMAGHGVNVGGGNNFSYYAQEHGYIIGLMSILPKTAYFQGLPKHFRKFDKFDFYFPSFAHLGEQPILNEELYLTTGLEDQETFGYTPRYAEYKHMLSSVHGEFRNTLTFWHMAREFGTTPSLNEDFINCVPTKRIFAVELQESETIYAHVFHDLKATRLMPYFGTPKGV